MLELSQVLNFLYTMGMVPSLAWQAEHRRCCEAVLQGHITPSGRTANGAASHVVFFLDAQHVLPPKLPERSLKGETLNDSSCLRRTGLTSHVCLPMQNHGSSSTFYSRFAVFSEKEDLVRLSKSTEWMISPM